MHGCLGSCKWWPANSAFEVAVGAILTQNTSWSNVEKALTALREAGGLTEQGLAAMHRAELEACIRPSGFFRQKAARLYGFVAFLQRHVHGDICALGEYSLEQARSMLLNVKGIGPETADSILLYALDMPTFVVDTYTLRIFSRHGLVPEDISYEELRAFFMDVLPQDSALFNEYHALLVCVAKNWCRKANPRCSECPLSQFLLHEVVC